MVEVLGKDMSSRWILMPDSVTYAKKYQSH